MNEAVDFGWFSKRMQFGVWIFRPRPRVLVKIDPEFDDNIDNWTKVDAFGGWWFDDLDVHIRVSSAPDEISEVFGLMNQAALSRYVEFAESVALHIAELKPGMFHRYDSRRMRLISLVSWQHRLRIAIGWLDSMTRAGARRPNAIWFRCRRSAKEK